MAQNLIERKTSGQDASTSGRRFDAFPYPPYSIQQAFMESLYETLYTGGIGLYESPTGTGKTLSLICGTLKWLEDTNRAEELAQKEAQQSEAGVADGLPSWFAKPFSAADYSNKENQVMKQAPKAATAKGKLPGKEDEEFEDLLPKEWHSEDEDQPSKRARLSGNSTSSDSEVEGVEEVQYKPRQVHFCSRTHSQLSQVVGELKRTRYVDSMSLVALASRQAEDDLLCNESLMSFMQSLCINDKVLHLKSASRINERCLELQKPGKDEKTTKGPKIASSCPYMKVRASAKQDLKDRILSAPMDVEDLARLGSRKAVCPYYASRLALPGADLVLLPYSGLLSQETRDSLGVRLAGSVVIVDEAHNLVNAVNAAHSAILSLQQLQAAHAQLTAYHQRFQARLAPGNDQNIQMLIHVTEVLQTYLERRKEASVTGKKDGRLLHATEGSSQTVGTVNDFLFLTGLDNVNLFRLVRYVKESKVLFRVAGFADAMAAKDQAAGSVEVRARGKASAAAGQQSIEEDHQTDRGTGPLQALMAFFGGLNNRNDDGRIITNAAAGTLKFVLLNAAAHFSKVLESAHAVILASGTLAPIASLQRQLFPGQPVKSFSCGHVVSKDRLLALALGQSPSGSALDFRHAQRGQAATIEQLGRLLINICQAVPQGVVVFFPSFSYAEHVQQKWAASGVLASLAAKKRVFTEPRGAGEVERVLKDYSESISSCAGQKQVAGQRRPDGAVLLCIVGGKMSEGINFGDGLGRCVVMVGLPYPNPSDPELLERMRYLDCETESPPAASQPQTVQTPGRDLYEDLCMKAVNQCIGRVVRHKDDWAAILLADMRWTGSKAGAAGPRQKLPAWIQESLVVANGFGDAYTRLTRFCRSMEQE